MPLLAPITTPNVINDPGYLLYAPLGTSLPTNTVTGSVFTDTWAAPWVQLGMTDSGSVMTSSLAVSEVDAAESLDPIAWRTTGRTATVAFALLSGTASNLALALNGGVKTVTGTAGTTLTQLDPPALGSEVRIMVGWESVDATVRFIGFQCINSGDVSLDFAKAPSRPTIDFTLNLEKPSSTQPFRWYFAGTARG
jgi:hypothetical protein